MRSRPSERAPLGERAPWAVAAMSAAALALSAPGQTIGVSAFVDPMIADLGVDRGTISLAYLLGTLAGAATLPLAGRALDRLGLRVALGVIAVAFAAALAGMSAVAGTATLLVGFVGIRMLGQSWLMLTATTWAGAEIRRRPGTWVGASQAAGSGAMALAPVAFVALIGEVGWRPTWLAAAAVVLVGVGLVRLGAPRPAAAGRGAPSQAGGSADRAGPHAPVVDGWSRGEAVRTAAFWGLTLGVVATGLIGTGLQFHQISILGEQGLTPAEAAANFLPQTAAAIAGSLAAGWLADKVSPKALVAVSMALLAGGMLWLPLVAPGLAAVAYAVLLGGSGGSMRALEATLMPRLFGTAELGSIRGVAMAVNIASTSLGPIVLAAGFERTGAYPSVVAALVVLPVAAALLTLVARIPPTVDGVRAAADGGGPGDHRPPGRGR